MVSSVQPPGHHPDTASSRTTGPVTISTSGAPTSRTPGKALGSADTLGHGTVFVDGFINTDNTEVTGRIDSNGDVDWYRVWFDAGEKYMIFFDDSDDSNLTINGVWEPVKSYITGPFDPNIDYIPV